MYNTRKPIAALADRFLSISTNFDLDSVSDQG